MTNLEKAYLISKATLAEAKKGHLEAKKALLKVHDMVPCRPCTEDEAAEYVQDKIETDGVVISHYAKSSSSWDAKKLEALMDTVPAIIEARRITYRIETRIKAVGS